MKIYLSNFRHVHSTIQGHNGGIKPVDVMLEMNETTDGEGAKVDFSSKKWAVAKKGKIEFGDPIHFYSNAPAIAVYWLCNGNNVHIKHESDQHFALFLADKKYVTGVTGPIKKRLIEQGFKWNNESRRYER